MASPEESVDEHPSFGVVSFSRINSSGGTWFFGSQIRDHPTYVELRISLAERNHQLGSDHFYDKKRLIEVAMTSSQFAELLTTMNMGCGVPCTIKFANGSGVEPPEFDMVEHERIADSFALEMKSLGVEAKALALAAEAILAKEGAITQADRKKLREVLRRMLSWVTNSAPFTMERFTEAATKVVGEAKADVDAFITNALVRAGLERFRSQLVGGADSTVAELPAASVVQVAKE